MQTTIRYGIALLLSLLLPAFAFAQVGAGAGDASSGRPVGAAASVNTNPAPTGVRANVNASGNAAGMARAKEKASQEIDRRVASLNAMLTRISGMAKVTGELKNNLQANTQVQITALNALKVKIDSDTDVATLKTDVQSITQGYRVFALVMPQARIAAAADREATILNMLLELGGKLEARLLSAQQAGANVDAGAQALADLGVKLQDARTQAQAALTASATLTPDNGEKAKMESNTAALKAAAAQIKVAQQDIVAGRKDIDTILKTLRSAGVGASASSTTQVQTP